MFVWLVAYSAVFIITLILYLVQLVGLYKYRIYTPAVFYTVGLFVGLGKIYDAHRPILQLNQLDFLLQLSRYTSWLLSSATSKNSEKKSEVVKSIVPFQ